MGQLDGSSELSTASMQVIQGIVDALQGEDKREHKGKENAVRAGSKKD